MKRIWKLAAWHWVLVRPTFFLLCGAFGAQQLAVLLIAAARPDAIGHSLATLYAACWQMPLFLLGHSMGSLIVRGMLPVFGQEYAGVILMGTAGFSRLAATARRMAASVYW